MRVVKRVGTNQSLFLNYSTGDWESPFGSWGEPID